MRFMEFERAGGRIIFAELLQNRSKGVGSGGKLKAEAGGVAPCHQHGTRWCAYGTSGIAIGKEHAFTGQAVNMRRFNQATAIKAHIIEPHIIGHDDDNIGRSLIGPVPTAGLPANGAVRRDRIIHLLDDADRLHDQYRAICVSNAGQDNQH